ncbi:MAG: hypothetical protein ACC642_04615, partial [Pseudomonadales bacterium]
AGPEQIIIRGPEEQLAAWQAAGRTGYTPWRSVFAIPYAGNDTLPSYLPRLVSTDLSSRVVAYRCQGLSCSLPIESLDEFRAAFTTR